MYTEATLRAAIARRDTLRAVLGLGVTQIIGWGCSFTAITIFGTPIGQTLGLEREVVFGVRPEEVILRREAAPGSVAGEVFVVEDLGNERLVTLDLGKQFVVARVHADYPAEMGETLWFGFDPARAHLFDPVSGRRLA